MHQKSLYFCLSFAVSSLIFYTCFYSNVRGAEYFQPQPALFNVRNVSYNSTNQHKEAIAGQNIDRGLANVSRIQDNLYDVQNETLGVQEVFMITLPERRDKRDAFAVQAALSGILYRQVDGVDGQKVPEKSLPYTMDMDKKAIGCWRAHLNILESMVERRVGSALIFEDDADWDVALKYQLLQFARGSRFLLDTPNNTAPFSPYGDGWDILWIGHCATKPDPDDNRRWVISDDPTVVPPDARDEFDKPNMTRWEDPPNGDRSTRIVHISSWNNCATGYIISLKGAEKVLYHMSMLPFNEPVDIGMGLMCMFKKSNFTCISPFPTLIGISKPAGNTSRWSDLDHAPEDQRLEEKGHSERLSFSTRQNVDRLLLSEDKFVSQFPDVYPEMSLAAIGRGVGHPEWIELPPKEESTAEQQEQNSDSAEQPQQQQSDSSGPSQKQNSDFAEQPVKEQSISPQESQDQKSESSERPLEQPSESSVEPQSQTSNSMEEPHDQTADATPDSQQEARGSRDRESKKSKADLARSNKG